MDAILHLKEASVLCTMDGKISTTAQKEIANCIELLNRECKEQETQQPAFYVCLDDYQLKQKKLTQVHCLKVHQLKQKNLTQVHCLKVLLDKLEKWNKRRGVYFINFGIGYDSKHPSYDRETFFLYPLNMPLAIFEKARDHYENDDNGLFPCQKYLDFLSYYVKGDGLKYEVDLNLGGHHGLTRLQYDELCHKARLPGIGCYFHGQLYLL